MHPLCCIKSSDKDTLGSADDWMHSHEDVVEK